MSDTQSQSTYARDINVLFELAIATISLSFILLKILWGNERGKCSRNGGGLFEYLVLKHHMWGWQWALLGSQYKMNIHAISILFGALYAVYNTEVASQLIHTSKLRGLWTIEIMNEQKQQIVLKTRWTHIMRERERYVCVKRDFEYELFFVFHLWCN